MEDILTNLYPAEKAGRSTIQRDFAGQVAMLNLVKFRKVADSRLLARSPIKAPVRL